MTDNYLLRFSQHFPSVSGFNCNYTCKKLESRKWELPTTVFNSKKTIQFCLISLKILKQNIIKK